MQRAPSDPTHSRQVGARDPAPCPFCLIVAGLAPATFLATWPDAIAFVPLGSTTTGHALIVPHRHIERPEDDAEVSGTAWRRGLQYATRLGADYNLIVNVGEDATQTIPHLHLHYLPRTKGDNVRLPWTRP